MKEFLFFTLLILVFNSYSDARRSGGGGRIRYPTKVRYAPTSYYRNRVFKCYSCDDAHFCAINPKVYAKAVLCPKGHLCSVIRTEIPVVNFTKSDGVKSSGTKTASQSSTSASLVSIWRGCKSPDSEELTHNLGDYTIHKHYCAKDLCNHGDGLLKCYECNGMGINDKCMVNPSAVSRQVICGPNEACYVERSTLDQDSLVPSNGEQWVSRGCIVSDAVGLMKYGSNESVHLFCRIGDLCNRMDALKIAVDSTSELRSSLTSLGLTFLLTLLLCF
ncbi:uncharacterized protein LOC130704244 isoform X2 [Daphnia carinata]|uniref:uncharacterized protein LOC130704244 isoform X2 n=1 Tax=Daphnia carinata TaxID=120202 RepID=UPI002869398F|nr:uncharacterized protein LOC130704244 isoform X2 [Daphnia carinata]